MYNHSMKKALWKSTIIIWSDQNPNTMELSDLARDAEVGDSYCSKQETILVENPEQDADAPSMEFFFERECDETCSFHDEECDGFCDHSSDHENVCC